VDKPLANVEDHGWGAEQRRGVRGERASKTPTAGEGGGGGDDAEARLQAISVELGLGNPLADDGA
jgi:hypothetical protein